MESFAALGVASNILQIVDFAARLVSRGYQVYHSADGRTQEHVNLITIADSLSQLSRDMVANEENWRQETTAAYKQLVALQDEIEDVVRKIHEAIDKARVKESHKVWASVYQAIRSVRSDKEISELASRLNNIRQRANTVLLISLSLVTLLWDTS